VKRLGRSTLLIEVLPLFITPSVATRSLWMTTLIAARSLASQFPRICFYSTPSLLSKTRNHVALQSVANKSTLVLVRHGESEWNLSNKFTGWYDCSLSARGQEEVILAGKLIKEAGITFQIAHTSMLKRAIRTLWHVMEETNLMWGK
jgi:hypothetical protein